MKNLFFLFILVLLTGQSCSKENETTEIYDQLEQRSNDNHKIWKLAQVTGHWDYTLTNGFQSDGNTLLKYFYGCTRPVGRAISSTDFGEENGIIYWDNSRTITYNDNFMVVTEEATEYGDEVMRTFQYDSENKWTGIITEVNGEVIDDEIEIGVGGQVKSYTHDGVKTVYEWKADNVTKVKTYVQASAALSTVKNSLVFSQLGFDINSRNKTKEAILISFNKLQKTNRINSQLRSNNSDEWLLVFVEEQTVDKNVVQPFSSAKKGYPGSVSDGGYLALPYNYIVNFKGYNVNEDGSEGELAYLIHFDSYTVKDNLPVNVKYSSFYADYEEDKDGNLLDYNDHGTFHYEYISGCNQ